MNFKKKSVLIQLTARPGWFTFRGISMVILGVGIAILSIAAPNVYMLGENASWIPAIGIIVFLVGVLRCIDALVAESVEGFLFNMQGGILDLIVGFIVICSTDGEINNLNLLIVGYLLTQGVYRNVLLSVAKTPNPLTNRITGLISILLGIMVWIDWPTSLWFIAFSLSVDISFRGWALVAMVSSNNNSAINRKIQDERTT